MSNAKDLRRSRFWSMVVAVALTPHAAFAADATPVVSDERHQEGPGRLQLIDLCLDRVEALVEQGHEARSLIVVLPDPARTTFAREVDIFLLAIQQAMAAEGLQLDKSCLRSLGVPEAGASSVATASPAPTQAIPGLMVYRGKPLPRAKSGEEPPAEDAPRWDVVYGVLVVGEVPPAGVAPGAMREALALVAEGGPLGDLTEQAGRTDALPPVTILGPTFSGSARSLGLALDGWMSRIAELKHGKAASVRQPVRIVSGSATNTDLDREIRAAIDADRKADLALTFHSMATPNDHLQSCLWNRVIPDRVGLDTRWGGAGTLCPPREGATDADNHRVALLVELSAFGREFEESSFEVITFPPHLGDLRNAYEKLRKDEARRGSHPSDRDASANILETDLTTQLQHGLSMFGRDNTLSSLDLGLNNSLRRLARERVRVVGIVATSVADKIFLAEKVRRYVPDVRLVTIEGDILLSHPRHFPSTAGMLVVSSFPMRVDEPSRLQLDFDWAHGVYLATRRLVASAAPPPDEHGVYVSVVSRTGLSLVDVVSGRRPSAAAQPYAPPDVLAAGFGFLDAPGLPAESFPTIWRSILYLASFLLLLVAYAVVRAFQRGEALLGIVPLELVNWRRWGHAATQGRDRVLHALVALLPVAAGMLFLVVAFPAFYSDGPLSVTTRLCFFSMIAGAVYLWSGLVVRTAKSLKEIATTTPWDPGRYAAALGPVLLAALGIATIVGLGVHAISWFSEQEEMIRQLFVERLLSMSGGVSPLVPVTLIAAVTVAWLVLALRWREVQPRLGDEPDGRGRKVSPLAGRSRRLWHALDLVSGRLKLALWVVAVVVPMLYLMSLFGTPPLRGIEEGPAVDWVTTGLLALALLVTLGAALSAALGWWRLRDLLELVARNPRLGIAGLTRLRDWPDLAPLRHALGSVARPDAATRRLLEASRGEVTLAWWHLAASWLDSPPASATPNLRSPVESTFREATSRLVSLAYKQLGTLMTFATLALITLFLAISTYPFEPRRMVLLYLGLLVTAVAAASVTIVLQSRSEPLLQPLTGANGSWSATRPLLQQLGFYAGLPLLGLLTARFPELRGFLGQWLDPIVMALK